MYVTQCRDYRSTRNIFQVVAHSLPAFVGQVILAALLAVSCTVVRCIVHVGTVLFASKVCTVHAGHCPPVSCWYFYWMNTFEFKP